MKPSVIYAFWLCCLLPLGAQAGPQINVGVVYDYLDGAKSTYMKRVFNGGTSTAFVKVNILEMIYAADGSYREVPVQTQAGATVRDGLMASPARLIVPANGTQGTRLLFMGNRDKERMFRVRFVPVVPETEDEFAVSEQERADYKQSLSAGVKVLAGYGTVFFVRPKNTRFQSVIQNDAKRWQLRNNGNSVVVVDEFKDCRADSLDCRPTTKHHIMVGRSFGFDKQAGREYRFNLIEGNDTRHIEIEG
ncbi:MULTISPECIES: pilus assembly protein [Pseudomonas]|uniref:Molecular chaperone n=1 Tax=Pseudomonas tritici TaxID=2745518 RepID=A0A8H9YY66_9PSED|nr:MULTISPECIES: pilus assembly protein [Pseudomonas]MBP2870580.1 molecular chaperone [Pseudomonas sp. SWRI144]MBW8125838.1 molecular chaperone [Pseudomonas sp. LAP_36]MBW8136547.1 molecular chaperone [Pseudomonas sp. PAMC 26818]QXH85145.1 molecular chaperone [Pseudomonas tritici]CRL99618.1 putative fimbrial protein TcfA [Pseudomonas sp. 24 R 17]